jgi:uncharacterized membrane protein
MWEKLRRCYPPQLELVSIFLVIITFYIALSDYSALPDTIPTHFNAQGIPNDWSSKRTIFIFPILNAVFFLSLTFFNFWFAIVDDPKRFINLPRKRKEAMTKEQAETLRIFLNRCLFILKIIMLGLFTYLTWQTIEIALGRASSLGSFFWLLIGALLVLTGYMVWKSFRLTKTPTQMTV